MERDVLNRIKWDMRINPSEFSLTYVDRFTPDEKEVRVTDVEVDGEFMKVGESTIPLHRIRKFLWRGIVVWDKRKEG